MLLSTIAAIVNCCLRWVPLRCKCSATLLQFCRFCSMHICRHLPSNYSCCFQQLLQLLIVGCYHLLDVGCCRVRLVRGAPGVPASSRVLFLFFNCVCRFYACFVFRFVLFFCFFVFWVFPGPLIVGKMFAIFASFARLSAKNKTPHCSLCIFCTPVSKNTGPKEKCRFCV